MTPTLVALSAVLVSVVCLVLVRRAREKTRQLADRFRVPAPRPQFLPDDEFAGGYGAMTWDGVVRGGRGFVVGVNDVGVLVRPDRITGGRELWVPWVLVAACERAPRNWSTGGEFEPDREGVELTVPVPRFTLWLEDPAGDRVLAVWQERQLRQRRPPPEQRAGGAA